MSAFVDALAASPVDGLGVDTLLRRPGRDATGHFLTFRTARAAGIYDRLMAANIITDHRRDRLRFGFGLYHDAAEAAGYVERIAAARAG
jgi:hypothetical protein